MAGLDIQSSIDHLVEILSQRPACVALTGAGLSTRSGIPDFRSPDAGLWARLDRLPDVEQSRVMTIHSFKENPAGFYQRFSPLLATILSAEPNPAHHALARLEADGYVRAIVTQNGDMLHQQAGSQQVIEIHGTLARAICLSCYRWDEGLPHWQQLLADGTVPHCRQCGGLLKPDVILTGEQLPALLVLKARRLLQACDVILAVGTSFSVRPVVDWVERACAQGKKLAIVNLTPTSLDSVAEVVIRDDVVEVLPLVVEKLSHSHS